MIIGKIDQCRGDFLFSPAAASHVEAFLLTALLGDIGPLQIAHRKMHKNFLLRACRQKW
jgi:hypothetical protein